MRKAHLGVVWHTKYTGNTIDSLSASFGVDSNIFKKTKNVWFDDAGLKDVSGSTSLSKSDSKKLDGMIGKIKGALKIAGKFINLLKRDVSTFSISALLKIFFNTQIRAGVHLSDTKKLVKDFKKYYSGRMVSEIGKKKTDKGKLKYKDLEKEANKTFKKYEKEVHFTIATYLGIADAKEIIVSQLEKIQGIGTFLKTDDGFKVTAPEGYVAINSKDGSAVKLVNRLVFAHANFTIDKNWDK